MSSRRVVSLHRHPVKGLYPEAPHEFVLRTGGGIEGDRAFAFQFLDDETPPELRDAPAERAPWMFKGLLAVQHDWPDLTRLEGHWNVSHQTLRLRDRDSGREIEQGVRDAEGRARLAKFAEDFLRSKSPFANARHPEPSALRLVGSASLDTFYADSPRGPVSLALVESLQALESLYGFAVDRRRFRLNLYLEGAPAWSELDWKERGLRIGDCELRITKSIGRCPNIDVDVETGARHSEVFPSMRERLGHSFFGMRADIVKGGVVRTGDAWELL